MTELIHQLIKTDPLTLSLTALLIVLSGATFSTTRTFSEKLLKRINHIELKLDHHLEEALPLMQEHKIVVSKLHEMGDNRRDREKLMLAIAKIAAKLDVEVDL